MVTYKTTGRCKKYIRELIKDIISETKPKYIFTLPNLNFDIENYAVGKGSHVVCCEIDKDIYKQQKSIAHKSIELYNDKMSNIVNKYKYDLAWLDSCGPISIEMINSLRNLKLSKEGNLVITIGLTRENKKYNVPLDRIPYYTKLLAGFGYYTHIVYEYRDYRSPMCVLFCDKQQSKTLEVYTLK